MMPATWRELRGQPPMASYLKPKQKKGQQELEGGVFGCVG